MRELEQRLGELEGRHTDLSRSYESLQLEYGKVKQELEKLRSDGAAHSHSHSQSSKSYPKDWDDSRSGEILDPLLFDVSAFCFDQDESHDRR